MTWPAPQQRANAYRIIYTRVAIFGAVGSGKTSACMHPFARQLVSWQATNPERRPAALVLDKTIAATLREWWS